MRIIRPAYRRIAIDIPLTFAGAPTSLKSTASIELNPIPAEAYTIYDKTYRRKVERGESDLRMRNLTPFTWKAILTYDLPPDGLPSLTSNDSSSPRTSILKPFKVSLVRSKKLIERTDDTINAEDLEIVDLERFLQITAPEHTADLKEAIANLNNLSPHGF